jgi:fatty acid-binding protein DegV
MEEIDENENAIIAYSGNNVDMSDFENVMLENFAFKSLSCGQIGPVIGSHVGPGAKLIVFVVKK